MRAFLRYIWPVAAIVAALAVVAIMRLCADCLPEEAAILKTERSR